MRGIFLKKRIIVTDKNECDGTIYALLEEEKGEIGFDPWDEGGEETVSACRIS